MKLRPGLAPAQLSLCAKQVWNAEEDEAIAILRANRVPLKDLAAALDQLEEVRGRTLRTILAAVKRGAT